jgi:predicted nucleic acid-binding protein
VRIAVDSNIILYAEGLGDPTKGEIARSILKQLPLAQSIIPIQALGEVHHNLTRKGRWPRERANEAIEAWRNVLTAFPTSIEAFAASLRLSRQHGLQIWDAVIVSVSVEAGCQLLLSEDMQSGFTWNGLSIDNPFLSPMNAALAALLAKT